MFGASSLDGQSFTRGNNARPDVEQNLAGDSGLRHSVVPQPGARSA
jgi:hypothetical protein